MFAVVLYAMLVIGLIAMNRLIAYHDNWTTFALDGRYRLYGLIAASVCAVDFVRLLGDHAWRRIVGFAVLLAAMLFNLFWYAYSFDEAGESARMRVAALKHWQTTGDGSRLPVWGISREVAAKALSKAIARGIFNPA